MSPKKKFFELLALGQNDLNLILESLWKISGHAGRHSLFLSFATKLLHTLDNSKPIFDAEVSAVINKRVTGNIKEEKIKSAKDIYAYLENLYLVLVGNEKIQEVIKEFRAKFSVDTKRITDQKVLDFLIWSLGKLKRRNGNV